MRRKDFLPDLEYEVIFNHWLKTYYEKSKTIIDGKEHHSMPSILVVYREGLSDGQLRKQVLREVRILKKVIANKVPKNLKYDPEIIYLTVNKHPSTRYFSANSKNAAPGSVIFDHFLFCYEFQPYFTTRNIRIFNTNSIQNRLQKQIFIIRWSLGSVHL
jgi:hypothetical protein